ncbi:hypothetical protein ACWT_1967 [Actinoplanes sp. SE50]|uniref:hypothetical protein n=1 Tax=unclassified Actinoplanes TaxID=2626549 RepID=UPI00023EC088|nr:MULTISPECIES: hypothetical protein [unclassified Actinoplanes]AEV82986.1 hypothetical protein ACPL_2089 [Actinoplanes sp. SE50/110]ATO81382.1 hypothetical protein ACWT_1967 [Actinoplanes sp. SE50]SLL98789.1 hypothetical protein ACSP50_2016 [Actinoplanes sp. SE50/110]
MHNLTLAFEGAWKVLLAGLILGAGLPAVFALGIRSLAYGAGGDAEVHAAGGSGPKPHRLGTAGGYLAFAVVLLGIALGITFIVATGFGKALSFEHLYPTIIDRKH